MTMQMNNLMSSKYASRKSLLELANELKKELKVFEKKRQELLLMLGLPPCYPFISDQEIYEQ